MAAFVLGRIFIVVQPVLNLHSSDRTGEKHWDRGGLRESCRQSGYTLRDEGELMLQQCRLLALANRSMRFQGWPLPT